MTTTAAKLKRIEVAARRACRAARFEAGLPDELRTETILRGLAKERQDALEEWRAAMDDLLAPASLCISPGAASADGQAFWKSMLSLDPEGDALRAAYTIEVAFALGGCVAELIAPARAVLERLGVPPDYVPTPARLNAMGYFAARDSGLTAHERMEILARFGKTTSKEDTP